MGNLPLSEQAFGDPSLSIPNAWHLTVHGTEKFPVGPGFFLGLSAHADETRDFLATCDGVNLTQLNQQMSVRKHETQIGRLRLHLSVISEPLKLMISVTLLPSEHPELVYATATSEIEDEEGVGFVSLNNIQPLPVVIIRKLEGTSADVIFCTNKAMRITYEEVTVCSPCHCRVTERMKVQT